MEFENKFSVDAPIDEVYATLLDIERVAPCVPGAQVLDKTGDESYKVGIKVKLGPVTQQYRGDVEVVERDEAAHRAVMSAKAREARGQGTANARVTMSLTEQGGQTHGTIASDVQLSGKAASMGQRMVKDVSTKLIDTFSKNLEAMLAGGGGAAEPAAGAKAPAASGAGTPAASSGGNGADDRETPASALGEGSGESAGAAAHATPAAAGAGSASAVDPPAPPSSPGRPAAGAPGDGGGSQTVSPESSGAAQSASTKSQADATEAAGEAPARERGEESPKAPFPSRPAPAAEPEGLPVMSLIGSVIVGRLKEPRVAGVVGSVVVAMLLIVRRRRR